MITMPFDSFILYALLAGIGIALSAGPLGCFVVWRKMAYFGDCLAHSALLGVAFSLISHLGLRVSIFASCTIFAFILIYLQNKRLFAFDTLLGIVSHSAIALGMTVISFSKNISLDIHGFLFGDILSLNLYDLYWIYGISITTISILYYYWSDFLLSTLHTDLAAAEGVNIQKIEFFLIGLLTLLVASSIQMVGILLIGALLIIPAGTARFFMRSPEKMAIFSAFLGIFSVIVGVYASFFYDVTTGPMIVSVMVALFILTFPISHILNKIKKNNVF